MTTMTTTTSIGGKRKTIRSWRAPLFFRAAAAVVRLRVDEPLGQRLFRRVKGRVVDLAGAVLALDVRELVLDRVGVVEAALGLVEQRLQDPPPAADGAGD